MSLGTRLVTRLLDRHLVPVRSRASRLEGVLGLNYQGVRRRLTDVSDWSIEELDRIARSFGESLESMVSEESSGMPRAILRVGEVELECRAAIAGPVATTSSPRLVAVRDSSAAYGDDARYIVMMANAEYNGEAHEVVRVVLDGGTRRKRIAVLDDDRDLAKSVAQVMGEYGYEARSLFTLEQAEAAIGQEVFDGYVFDWLVGDKSSEDLIAKIRSTDATCPIVVLTGEMTRGNVAERELMAMARRYRFSCYEKPVRTSVIQSALEVGFSMQAPHGASAD
jgi:CheY-like chemotaxis protein